MIKFLRRFFPAPQVKVVLLARDPTTLRIHEWRADQELAKTAAGALANPNIRLMLQVVENDHPAFSVLAEASIEDRAIFQARCEGYTVALSNLRSLAKYSAPVEPLEETFDPAEETST